MKRKLLTFIAIVITISMFAVACGQSHDSDATASEPAVEADDGASGGRGFSAKNSGAFRADEVGATGEVNTAEATEQAADVTDQAVAKEPGDVAGGNSPDTVAYDTSRKIVYSSNISIESKKFDDDAQAIKDLVKSNKGYFESSSVDGSAENSRRTAYYTVRIPAANYDSFMDAVGDIGSVVNSSSNANDITSSYVDVQARLKTLNTKLARLEELEAKAESVEDLLDIEDRINDVVYEIESYSAQLKMYDDWVDYCTVNIDIREVATYTEPKQETIWSRFGEAFKNSMDGFVKFIQGIVFALIYLLPFLVVGLVIFFTVRAIIKKKRGAKPQNMIQPPTINNVNTDKENKE